MLEVGANKKLKIIMDRDYTTYTGKVLEKYFRAKIIESELFTHISSWWDRKGENEIDIIAADEIRQGYPLRRGEHIPQPEVPQENEQRQDKHQPAEDARHIGDRARTLPAQAVLFP